MKEHTITHEEELEPVVEEVLSVLPQREDASLITLSGELGAGKTAFVKALGRELGVGEHITSPTFVVMKSYTTTRHSWIQTLVHIDAYRIEDIDEMRVLKLEELYKEPGVLICIEWPEHIKELIREDALEVRIDTLEGEARKISYGS